MACITVECSKCGVVFDRAPSQLAKYSKVCRSCERSYNNAYRAKRSKEGRPIIEHPRTIEERRAYEKEYKTRPGVRARKAQVSKKIYWSPDNQQKILARRLTRRAIESGDLVRCPCEVCGEVRVDAHHDDYAKPLEIRWLCRFHHTQHHKQMSAAIKEARND